MRLSLSERWKLHRIEAAVRRSDPRLAALLAIFTRLTAQDAMPPHERLDASEPWTGLMG
jgi:hypothetical protein